MPVRQGISSVLFWYVVNICNSVGKYGRIRKDRDRKRNCVGRKKIKKCFLERRAEIALEVVKNMVILGLWYKEGAFQVERMSES